MFLKEMKIKTFSLIEEYYPEVTGMAEDEDVLNKINGVVNQIQLDLMKYRKINTSKKIVVGDEDSKTINLKEELPNLYQIKTIDFKDLVEYKMPNEETIILPDDFVGEFDVYYYKYPTLVKVIFEGETEEEKQANRDLEDETYEFELDDVLLEIMPYGIASDLLKMDMISSYGKYFYERYLEMKNSIDPRRTAGIIKVEGGVDL